MPLVEQYNKMKTSIITKCINGFVINTKYVWNYDETIIIKRKGWNWKCKSAQKHCFDILSRFKIDKRTKAAKRTTKQHNMLSKVLIFATGEARVKEMNIFLLILHFAFRMKTKFGLAMQIVVECGMRWK